MSDAHHTTTFIRECLDMEGVVEVSSLLDWCQFGLGGGYACLYIYLYSVCVYIYLDCAYSGRHVCTVCVCDLHSAVFRGVLFRVMAVLWLLFPVYFSCHASLGSRRSGGAASY